VKVVSPIRRDRYQGGPGTLTDDLLIPDTDPSALADEPLADLAARFRLRPSAARPGVFAYAAMYTEARRGQPWQVLTPLLNAAVYYLIFGVILGTSRGVPNFLGFLITGIFVFNFTQRAFITTSRVMPDSLPLIRALPFSRACLPVGYVLIELEQLGLALIVLTAIVLGTGEPLTWYWLLAIPALLLQSVFSVGMSLFLARLGLRHHPLISYLLQVNPAAVFITLVRNAILESQRLAALGGKPYNARRCDLYYHSSDHVYDSAYRLVIGFLFFWEAETRYGRG
jgi:hypothetical protein